MITNPFLSPIKMICPSILSADFSKLSSEIAEVLNGGADFLHCDILDGHFAPNISFGPHVIEGARKSTAAYLDVHLMITDPLKYAPAFVKAGANSCTFHAEVVDDVAATAKELRKLGCHVGITSRPSTPLEKVLPAFDFVDVVLVMSVEPGFSGQKFMPEVLPRVTETRKRLRPDQRVQIDGGIKSENIRLAGDAGVDWFVVASAIFDQPDRAAAIAGLRQSLSNS